LYASGATGNASHSWGQGKYNIRVKARDIPYNKESSWSGSLPVTMPKIYLNNPIIQLFLKMLERFPLLEKILNLYYN
ncbi:MAG: hypothetical protein MUO82_08935, partial [Candidatus Thermoplasmatota archaeon]|nr:hypothetical protein [Candidatus Thermoplasmatota archaeon]